MATFLENLRERNKNRKDMNTPRVTNPKVPTKVERDVAAFEARQKPMPNFKFGTGTVLEKMKARMAERAKNGPSSGMHYGDPAFKNGNSEAEWDKLFDDLIEAIRVKNKLAQNTLKEGV